jgi:hypothetical protein
MTRGVRWYLVSSLVLVVGIILAGCSHYLMADRESWRHEAEVSCLNSGAVRESAARVRISPISGPGACGADYPLRVSALGEPAPLSYDDEVLRPPGAIPDGTPNGAMPQRWPGGGPAVTPAFAPPVVQATPLPPPAGATAAHLAYPPAAPLAAPVGAPLSLKPPGVANPDDDIGIPGGPPHPYYGGAGSGYGGATPYPQQPASPAVPPLGPPAVPLVTAAIAPVEVQPPATLACPIVSALDQWISGAVQPAALHWFRQPVVEIKQISAYSCRGMNGNPNAHISEHAFGNALDVAEFDLADGHKISVQYGWHGTPEEQGFLHDVQATACDEFTTVLAPGANVYHYNHIHVDLMRRASGRRICEPGAIPGEVVAERARARFAAQRYGDHSSEPGVTGSIKVKSARRAPAAAEDDDSLPLAVPGED